MFKLISFGRTDMGLKRSNNEDAFSISRKGDFLALADGMGGAAAGEVASKIFVDTTIELFLHNQHNGKSIEIVKNIFHLSNQRILNHVKDHPEHKGMGCTAELIVFEGEQYILGHVGDSRTYVFRNGVLKQLTKDHSLVQDQIDQGLLTPEAAKKHHLRNIITRSGGIHEQLARDLMRGEIISGDLFLLCSDGLTDMVPDVAISAVLSFPQDLSKKGEKLIEMAKDAGGYDNVTVVLGEIIEG